MALKKELISTVSKLMGFSVLRRMILDENDIDAKTKVGANTAIKGSSIKGNVSIGNNCRINFADISGEVKIGNHTSVWGPNIFIRSAINPIEIGNFCSIARNVTIQEYNHNAQNFTTYFIEQNFLKSGKHKEEIVSKGSVRIGHDVWIGANAVVVSGADIGTGAIIAAGSVVNGAIPPYAIAGGVPAKVLKYRFSEDVCEKLLATEWWSWPDEKLKNGIGDLQNIVKESK